jgi:hypothetical protein
MVKSMDSLSLRLYVEGSLSILYFVISGMRREKFSVNLSISGKVFVISLCDTLALLQKLTALRTSLSFSGAASNHRAGFVRVAAANFLATHHEGRRFPLRI